MRSRFKIIPVVLVAAVVLVGGAIFLARLNAGPPLRVNEDQCAVCGMGIWNPSYAAAIELEFGSAENANRVLVRYYDDMGCLLDEEAEHPERPVRRIWVRDSMPGSERWLDATTAGYVMTVEIKTPMASGIAAFGSERDAKRVLDGLKEPVALENLTQLRRHRAAWRKERGLKP